MSDGNATRGGFTLLEVILAIALSATLMVLLGGAIGLYIVRLESSRESVEQSQLARGVLRMVADDLRSAATTYEQDTSVTLMLAASQASFDVEDMDQIGADADTAEAEPRPPVGLLGDAQQVQLDVLRSRPIDPALTFGAGEVQAAATPLRGVTSIRYFVTEAGLSR
ncbi:MAG: type II secretion system protein, partial [Planctomycetota bacterium]